MTYVTVYNCSDKQLIDVQSFEHGSILTAQIWGGSCGSHRFAAFAAIRARFGWSLLGEKAPGLLSLMRGRDSQDGGPAT